MAVHGTGTPLGDPIEVGALAGALGSNPGASSTVSRLMIGSNKVRALPGRASGQRVLPVLLSAMPCNGLLPDTSGRWPWPTAHQRQGAVMLACLSSGHVQVHVWLWR